MLAISLAWNIPSDEIVGAPKWLSSTNFDIIAKAPVEAAPVTGGAPFRTSGRCCKRSLSIVSK